MLKTCICQENIIYRYAFSGLCMYKIIPFSRYTLHGGCLAHWGRVGKMRCASWTWEGSCGKIYIQTKGRKERRTVAAAKQREICVRNANDKREKEGEKIQEENTGTCRQNKRPQHLTSGKYRETYLSFAFDGALIACWHLLFSLSQEKEKKRTKVNSLSQPQY